MIGPYSHPLVYHLCMRILYGRHFPARYEVISQQIPARSQVVDVCCGDCYLYTHYLKQKHVDYLGLDTNSVFLGYAHKRGVRVREFDLWKDPVPRVEIIVMQSSLYQFVPHHRRILTQLLTAARSKVIVAEPIRNLSTSKNPIVALLAKKFSDPGFHDNGNPYCGKRFDMGSLTELFTSFDTFQFCIKIPGERELVGIFAGKE